MPFDREQITQPLKPLCQLLQSEFTACLFWLAVGTAGAQTSDSLRPYHYRSLVAHSDLPFYTPPPSRHDGLPIGNGRLGTLGGTTPAALHYQVNHDDLFCGGNNTLASPRGHTDYSAGGGYLDINLYANELTVRLSVEQGLGKLLSLTATAVSYDRRENVGDLALKQLAAAQGKSFDDLLQNNRKWWDNFCPKGFIHLHSADGVVDNVGKYYTYFLYLMGSCSRATYRPRFCGVLWGTDGDLRDLYLARKPWSKRSNEFDAYARNQNGLKSRWNYRYTDAQQAPFAWTSHVLS